jgi:hypothetical protein
MPTYLVKIRQEREWEGPVEAPDDSVAVEIAQFEAIHGEIVDQQVIVEEITGSAVETLD